MIKKRMICDKLNNNNNKIMLFKELACRPIKKF